ncbi:anhydro-N-acetylmuramic acid kinase [Colwellia sp. BRX8-7]|jgi:anhydro-N-acetylmuramic acid kinase|uniref:anhydro-N-acetylmuramic acid kinase n=1 Tax=Colwellia sp. BRX8-7 TaxID=2759833 RepID=UPI0015F3812E|nr:anhydro-N-acetylmuramic acid kinase [Colwellia sp. BRX8-7]MBA6338757.1 anhydro-N-acetylmuramic acid kinase [Colwellia sp. BRX8-7]
MTKATFYIGLMSGTSADGIDLALVDFTSGSAELVASYYQAYDNVTRQKITELYLPNHNEIDRAFSLDITLAHQFSEAISTLLDKENLVAADIIAIGNHGQTIRHRPTQSSAIEAPFTLQIGCNQTLAVLTGIRVIGDFRTKDIALGGQGAPLVPAFHQFLLPATEKETFLVNIGGIANITFLPKKNSSKTVLGFDTGPGNALLDAWCFEHSGKRFDNNGDWGSSGTINQTLLIQLLTDDYFLLSAPKSTGREYFTLQWLAPFLTPLQISAVDVQATLTALTACSIAADIKKTSNSADVYLCGGGIDNNFCYKLIKQELKNFNVHKIHSLKLNNNALEAMAFAWLAFAYDKKIYGNIPAVTGARKSTVLGCEFFA